jgi:adenine/guanine phosphoribosyltransferase-like PRPP-binding protein
MRAPIIGAVMDLAEVIRRRATVVPNRDPSKSHLIHSLNGRGQQVDAEALDALVRQMAQRIDVSAVDCILGIPEGGTVPAYAFARAVGRPLLLAARVMLQMPAITFEEPHVHANTTRTLSFYGLAPGQRVMIVEDELTNGHTAVNAVRALRAGGVVIEQIATLLAIDHPALWRRLAAEGLTAHAGVRLPPEYAPRQPDQAP